MRLILDSSPLSFERNLEAISSIGPSRLTSTFSTALAARLAQSNCSRGLGCCARAHQIRMKKTASLLINRPPAQIGNFLLHQIQLAAGDFQCQNQLLFGLSSLIL